MCNHTLSALAQTCEVPIVIRLNNTTAQSLVASHASPEVRKASLSAVRQLGHAGKGEWILALLDDPDPTVRAQAALSCGSLHRAGSADSLRRLEKDKSLWVRMRAFDALERLLPPGSASLAS